MDNWTSLAPSIDIEIDKQTDFDVTIQSSVETTIILLIAVVALTVNTSLWVIILTKRFKLRKTSNGLLLCLSG